MPPLKGVEFGHGDRSKPIRSLTLPSAAPVFATHPFATQPLIVGGIAALLAASVMSISGLTGLVGLVVP